MPLIYKSVYKNPIYFWPLVIGLGLLARTVEMSKPELSGRPLHEAMVPFILGSIGMYLILSCGRLYYKNLSYSFFADHLIVRQGYLWPIDCRYSYESFKDIDLDASTMASSSDTGNIHIHIESSALRYWVTKAHYALGRHGVTLWDIVNPKQAFQDIKTIVENYKAAQSQQIA